MSTKKAALTVELPDSFTARTVELIILPADETEAAPAKESPAIDVDEQGLTEFQRFLLTAPDMSDDEYNDYLLKKQGFREWSKRSV